ncbi:MAG: phage major tail tube protein [Planctomycetaceae bacterium]|nr:phage major tail tube protein [Planctomycetaceae bacterium]
MNIPEAVAQYKLYNEAQTMIGITTIDFPSLTSLAAEISGAGIGGKITKAIVGMFDSMSVTFNIRAVTPDQFRLLHPGTHHLEAWAAVQVSENGRYAVRQHKVIIEGEFKTLTTGKHAAGETQDRSLEMEVLYYKEQYDGYDYIEIDKLNMMFVVEGRDILAEVRAAIG